MVQIMRLKSEYKKAYQPFDSTLQEYCNNLTYRHARRNLEFSHQPLSWLGEENDSSDGEEILLSVPQAGIFDNTAAPNFHAANNLEFIEDERQCISMRDEATQVGNDLPPRYYASHGHSECESYASPRKMPNASSARRKRDQRNVDATAFVSYGSATGKSFGNQRTFNVRAPCDVHPSALRALENRKERLNSNKFTKLGVRKNVQMNESANDLKQLGSRSEGCNYQFQANVKSPHAYLFPGEPAAVRLSRKASARSYEGSYVECWNSEYRENYASYPTSAYAHGGSVSVSVPARPLTGYAASQCLRPRGRSIRNSDGSSCKPAGD